MDDAMKQALQIIRETAPKYLKASTSDIVVSWRLPVLKPGLIVFDPSVFIRNPRWG